MNDQAATLDKNGIQDFFSGIPWVIAIPFFAFCCGMNFAIFACLKCWPFRLIPQPFGTCVALFSMLIWNALLTLGAIPFISSIHGGEGGIFETQVFAWHTVFWGFAWVYCFGVGQTPYLWRGQKTPGTWDDVD